MPQPRFKQIKKMKMEELAALALELKIDSTGKKKPDLLKDIQAYLEAHVLQPVSVSSAKAGEITKPIIMKIKSKRSLLRLFNYASNIPLGSTS